MGWSKTKKSHITYIDSTRDETYGQYWHSGEWVDFEAIEDTLYVFGETQTSTHYRTVHGPVFGDDLARRQVFSQKMTFWEREMVMLKAFEALWKARTLAEFEAGAALVPISLNLFYADRDQHIAFWHLGKYQDRRDGVDPRLPHRGDGSEEWAGFIPFAQLPAQSDPPQGYFVNWNNKPASWWDHGDSIPWAFANELDQIGGTDRVAAIDNFIGPLSQVSFDNLKDVPRQIGDHGTYQQAIELSTTAIFDENILPPGQSGFISLAGQPSPHFADQWPLHMSGQFKDMEFELIRETPTLIRGPDRSALQVPALGQNAPNPFNDGTVIRFVLPVGADIDPGPVQPGRTASRDPGGRGPPGRPGPGGPAPGFGGVLVPAAGGRPSRSAQIAAVAIRGYCQSTLWGRVLSQ